MLQILVAYESNLTLQKSFASSVEDGNYQLARARYIRGSAEMGSLMWPDLMAPSLTVDITEPEGPEGSYSFTTCKGEQSSAPVVAAEGLRKRHTSKQHDNDSTHEEDAMAPPQVVDPIRWFGLQPPKPLRSAQVKFVKAVTTGVDLAQQRMHISRLLDRYELLKAQKQEMVALPN